MTRQKSPDSIPDAAVARYYQQRAEGGVGLIITEGTTVDRPAASSNVAIPNFHDPRSLAGWRAVVNAVHAVGGKIAPQIWHQGIQRKPGTGPNPQAASEGPSVFEKYKNQAMTDEDIADTIEAFASSAAHAKAIGFDAVELHGAHGYLIDQFLWEATNQRADAYGGDHVGRTTFAADVVRAVRARVGPDFVVILRFSQWKLNDYTARLASNPQQLESILAPLADAGIDIFHASTRRFWEPEFEGSNLNLAGWTKQLTGKPTITVGSVGLSGADFTGSMRGETAQVGDLVDLEKRLAEGEFDLVAVGRALISDPTWAKKIEQGRTDELLPFEPSSMAQL